jgi:hypothetical protein
MNQSQVFYNETLYMSIILLHAEREREREREK